MRSIAELTGLSPGYVPKVVQELEERGYVARRDGGLTLQHVRELQQDWVQAHRKHWIEQRDYFVSVYNLICSSANKRSTYWSAA